MQIARKGKSITMKLKSSKLPTLFASGLLATLLAPSAHADGTPGAYSGPPTACCFTWSGFYYGVNAGAAWSNTHDVSFSGMDTGTGGLGSEIADGTTPGHAKLDWGTSFTGGAQAGYNWQLSKLVMGLEADLQWLNGYANFTAVSTNPLRPTVTTNAYREMNMLATVRGRMGVTVTERSFLFVTGGLGVGDANLRISSSCQGCTPLRDITSASAGTPTGLVWGGGYEAALGDRVSIKAEYLHFDLGDNRSTVEYAYPGNTSSMTGKVRDEGSLVRVGVNFRLDRRAEALK
jgi:outer membrane immunogenic protein